jgi:hypothetical protein
MGERIERRLDALQTPARPSHHPDDECLLREFRRRARPPILAYLRDHDFRNSVVSSQIEPFEEMAEAWRGERDTKLDHARVQIARLEPALRLAARGVADGDLAAIDRLLRVLDRLDRYSAVEGAEGTYDENARERLLTKLNSMAERIRRAREAGVVETDRGEDPPSGEAGFDAPEGIDFAE